VGAGDASGGAGATATASTESKEVKSEMPGVILRMMVNQGDTVAEGTTLLVLEAMKMEVSITSPFAGTVTSVDVSQGDHVANGQLLARIG